MRSLLRGFVVAGLVVTFTITDVNAGDAGETRRLPAMVSLPSGDFQMGSPVDEAGREDDEGPQHAVSVPAFEIGKFEVTVAEFSDFVARTGQEPKSGCWYIDPVAKAWREDPARSWRTPGFAQGPDHPVTCVAWSDAVAYAKWLGTVTGRSYRLPTEAEWEYAARAGTSSSRFWGESDADACRHANAVDQTASVIYRDWKAVPCDDGYLHTSPVGRFTPNAWGLHDTAGNLWEWVSDCWRPDYREAPADGSASDPAGCTRRVIRGAAWDDERDDLRSANRLSVPADRRYNTIGFRLAR